MHDSIWIQGERETRYDLRRRMLKVSKGEKGDSTYSKEEKAKHQQP